MASATAPLLDDDDTIAFGDEDLDTQRRLKHPIVTFFHLCFRVAALVVYMFCGLFGSSFIASFVTVVLLLSMDFWTVKNITGRLLVGLRWWNYIDDNGKSHWVYESRKGDKQNRIVAAEARIFWLALFICPLLWVVFFLFALFGLNLKWLLLVCIALVLNGANLYGYIKCKVGGNERLTTTLSNVTTNFFRQQMFKNVSSVLSSQQPTNTPGQGNVI